jgi:apolipoprotein D and lipocalin family protein
MVRLTVGMTIAMVSMLIGCTGVPDGLKPVEGFDLDKYLGKWYEIARLDHKFERGLNNVSATYAANDSGGITVINKGYKTKKGEWKSIKGVARSAGDATLGSLEVSFFGPFYGSYNIIALDRQNYNWAMVVGPSRSYFWILSRAKDMDEAQLNRLVSKAAEMGIDTEKLILVEQNLPEG